MLDADLARARTLITGAFAAQFEQTARNVIVPASRDQSFTVTAEVARAALVDIQPDRVDMLLFVDQTVRASTQPQPQRQTLQLAVSMTKDADGPWLISDVNPL
jgi:Mce-associated membrane protein